MFPLVGMVMVLELRRETECPFDCCFTSYLVWEPPTSGLHKTARLLQRFGYRMLA